MTSSGLAAFQWRRFEFFDRERIDNHNSSVDSIMSQLKNLKLFGIFGGRGTLILATQSGFLHFASRHFNDLAIVSAFQSSIIFLTGLKKHSYILAVGTDEQGSSPILKIWNYDKIEVGIKPTLTRSLKLENRDFSCLAAHENLNYMAVGFKSGKVFLYHKDIARGRHSNQRVLCDLGEEITGLIFSPQAKDVYLYVSTPTSLHAYGIVGKERKIFSDRAGCEPLQICPAQLSHPDQHMAIVCPGCVRFYGPDGMGSTCSTTSGDRFMITWQLDYLFVASRDSIADVAENELPSKHGSLPPPNKEDKLSKNVLTIYDSVNKFIAFTGTFKNITYIVAEFGAVFVFTKDGMLFRLTEKDLQSKLDLLFRKNQYELAIKLAKSQRYGDSGLVKIFKHYGDHLFSKGDYLSAAEQYRQTIGGLETSYVIRQLLTGAAPPAALACYLEGVHEIKKATAHHTSLLLNCYIKMKDEAKLEAFILKNEKEVTFDAEIAVQVLRSAHFNDLALRLAAANHVHKQVVSIYIEDMGDKEHIIAALDYVEKHDPGSANWYMRRYGQQFMEASSERTAGLMKELLSQNQQAEPKTPTPLSTFGGALASGTTTETSSIPSFKLFAGRPGPLIDFLESMVKLGREASPPVYRALIDVYVQQWNSCDGGAEGGYLKERQQLEDKILILLRNKEIIDPDQSLLLTFASYKFYPGIEFILEKSGNLSQLMSHYADHNAFEKMVQLCERKASDQTMRLRLLSQLTSSREGAEYLPKVISGFIATGEEAVTPSEYPVSFDGDYGLTTARQARILAPEVINALCNQSEASACDIPFSYMRDYLLAELHQVDAEADKNAEFSMERRRQTVELRQKLDRIKDNAFQESRCRSCNFKLELPTVHFMCQHSYHSSCLDYGDPDCCPRCNKEHSDILERYRAFEEMSQAPSTNVHELAEVPDLFSTLGDLLAKGLLSGGIQGPAANAKSGNQTVSLSADSGTTNFY